MTSTHQNQIHERVRLALEGSSVAHTVLRHADYPVIINGPEDFSIVLDVDQARVTKTLFIAEQQAQGRCALLCIPSTARADLKAAAAALGYARVEMGSDEQLQTLLGYPRHGVSPLGAPAGMPVLLDQRLLNFSSIYVGGGEAAVEIELSPSDVQKTAGAITGKFSLSPN